MWDVEIASTDSRSDTNATAATTTSGSSLPMQARLLISLIPFSLYGFLFTRIPPYVTAVPEELTDDGTKEGWEGEGWLASSMGRVIVLGIIVLGGLSGFGAVRTAWNFIEHLKAGRWVLTPDYADAQTSRLGRRHPAGREIAVPHPAGYGG